MNPTNLKKFEERFSKLQYELSCYGKKLDESKKVFTDLKKELSTTNEVITFESEFTARFTETAMAAHKSLREVDHNMHRIEKEMVKLGKRMMTKHHKDLTEEDQKYQ